MRFVERKFETDEVDLENKVKKYFLCNVINTVESRTFINSSYRLKKYLKIFFLHRRLHLYNS